MAYYAWSNIRAGTTEEPVNIARGDKVSQSDLGVDDANWEATVESGAVRDKEFPAPEGYEGSAIDYLREKLQEAQSLSGVDEEEAASELAAVSSPQPTPEAAAAMPTPSESEPKATASSTKK